MYRPSTAIATATGRGRATLICAVLVGALLPGMGACKDSSEASGGGAASGIKESAAALATYTVRGEVRNILRKGDKITTLDIHHEEMPEFVNREGEKTGMASMTMPFGVPNGLVVDWAAVGAKVELTCTVDWERRPIMEITRLTKLPPDTELTLTGM
ncbi:MAG: copper-binding protein [Myxococcota bacterium]